MNSATINRNNFFLISGPCVIEKEDIMRKTAEAIKLISERLDLPVVYKSSFMKDNRSSVDHYAGPGIDEGLRSLQKIRQEFDLPILSDVHFPGQAKIAGEVLDIIQIPAYLCMQTTLVVEAAKTGKTINLKHGQFISPKNMSGPIRKIESTGNKDILLTERRIYFWIQRSSSGSKKFL